ncbi:calcium-binding protein [Microvirga pudoricolor]|uniref:calcium-binding protein n=1 Tax=Microvirga pudoricolor TaxID=2778729 RepID=UPI0019519ADF|nr:calcium-binding protein [Microvirga pudoricolor]MBM6593448.1 hypothetical protein [Microvirga pudoricolor]
MSSWSTFLHGMFARAGLPAASPSLVAGINLIAGSDAGETLAGTEGQDSILGFDGNDSLWGAAGSDTLVGGGQDDSLNGAAGVDSLVGGTGNDHYYVDDQLDEILEDTGFDTVVTSVMDYTLGSGWLIEVLQAAPGPASISLTGSTGAETIIGNDGNNRIDGGGGLDVMSGGKGNDTYIIDQDDVVIETAGEGTDTIVVSFNYALEADANIEILKAAPGCGCTPIKLVGNNDDNTLIGNEGVNDLSGGGGADILDGGAGADVMSGGRGDDLYFVDNAGDVVREGADQGYDTVIAAIDYVAPDHVEVVRAAGGAALKLQGNAMANLLVGGAGADTLVGVGGNDTLLGGSGNDSYSVDAVGVRVTENANGGVDTVFAGFNYTLSDEVENLTALGVADLVLTGNGIHNLIVGNGGNNTLDGGMGNDTLMGGSGHDRMIGGAGDDIYHVGAAGDVAVEGVGAGLDTVMASVNHVLGAHLENLTAVSGSRVRTLSGNTLNNVVTGNEARNKIKGGAGNDTLAGGLGKDVLNGGKGADHFVFDTALRKNVDTIKGFSAKHDTIDLSRAIFKIAGKKKGAIKEKAFWVGKASHDGDDRIVYDDQSGRVYYDADGNGARKAIYFAKVGAHKALTHKDFFLV